MKRLLIILTFALALNLGCGQPSPAPGSNSTAAPTGQIYLADAEPKNATPVGDARQSSKDGDEVAVVGLIGGSTEPFIDGLAAFTVVDPKVEYCPPEEGCPTPWDYCCTQNEVKDNIATVKIVDEKGKTVAEDARPLLGVKELTLIVAKGTAKRDDQGNLTIQATEIFVKQ